MTAIIVRSPAVAEGIASVAAGSRVETFPGDDPSLALGWLAERSRERPVRVLFYEPSFLPDPAPFRSMSPHTVLVAVYSPSETEGARDAVRCGVAAGLAKPFTAEDVRGVYALASR